MTNQEAIEDIRNNIKPIVSGKSLDMAIEALSADGDTISRQAAIEVIKKYYRICDDLLEVIAYEDLFEVIAHEIERLPTAQPEPDGFTKWALSVADSYRAQPERKTGRWEYHSNPAFGMNPEDAYCSKCGFHIDTTETDNFDNYYYCPMCGADMRGRA